jgi:hypothetical protein
MEFAMAHVVRKKTGAVAGINHMTPDRAARSAQISIAWPVAVALPEDETDRATVLIYFMAGLDTRPRDEWVDIDVLELARYCKLMVLINRRQDDLDAMAVTDAAYKETLTAVTKMSGIVATIGRKLYLHKVVANINNAASQAATEREARRALDQHPVGPNGRPIPTLIA